MKTTAEICEHLRNVRFIAELLPTERRRSVPFPVLVDGRAVLVFLYYLDQGVPGRSVRTLAPVARVLVDKATASVAEIRLPPLVWRRGHDATTVIGESAPAGLVGVTQRQAVKMHEELHALTDQLCSVAAARDADADLVRRWHSLFESMCVPGLKSYFELPMQRCEYFVPPAPLDAKVQADAQEDQDARSAATETVVSRNVAPAPAPAISSTVVTGSAYALLDRLRAVLRRRSEDLLLKEVHRVNRMLAGGEMPIAVVGERSRGKSTLINRLIGQHLLPEGAVPTTAMMTRVRAGTEPTLSFVTGAGVETKHPLTVDTVAEYCRDAGYTAADGVLEVRIEDSWLARNSIAIVDTPGVDGSAESERAAFEAVSCCEGVVLTVAATSPVSLSEKALLDEHVFRHAVPRVAFVVTKLDLLPTNERAEILKYIRDKATGWNQAVEVWSCDQTMRCDAQPSGIEEIRERLCQWASDPGRAALRAMQAVRQLGSIASALKAALARDEQLMLLDEQERAEVSGKARMLLDNDRLVWDELRLEFEKRELAAEAWFKEALAAARSHVHQLLSRELGKIPNPRDWWLYELPHRLAGEWKSISRAAGQDLAKRMQDDQRWLVESAAARFQVTVRPNPSAPVKASVNLAAVSPEMLIDLRWYQNAGRVVGAVAMVGGFLVAPGGGPVVASTLAAFVTEQFIKQKIDEQRKTLSKLLDDHLARVARESEAQARESIRKAYTAILGETVALEGEWMQMQLKRISETTPATSKASRQDLEEASREIVAIIDQLNAFNGAKKP